MNILAGLKPEKVMEYFEKISSIPRGSGDEKRISDWLYSLGKEKGLETYQDKYLNVIIKKKGTVGYENLPPVILQSHMDMVCEKNGDIVHDFKNEGIKLQVNGDIITAIGTTLGADDGIGMALSLALLDTDTPHPPLELLFTSDEEAGMSGAEGLDPSILQGRLMLNLDSDNDGEIYVSSAGGCNSYLSLPIKWDECGVDYSNKEVSLKPCDCGVKYSETKGYKIMILGLEGGHSGADIHLEKGNSNILLGRLLSALEKEFDFRIAHISGGAKENAIPRESEATIVFSSKSYDKFLETVKKYEEIFRHEHKISDNNLKITFELHPVDKVLDEVSTKKIIKILTLHPNGINSWSLSIPNLVESSLNLGVITFNDSEIIFSGAVRSSVLSKKFELLNKIETLAELIGVNHVVKSHYPAWEYKSDSQLRELFAKTYKKLFNEELKIKAVHAGLEGGFISEKIPGIDIISYGPNVKNLHTPDESMSISSVEKSWNLILGILKNMKNS